MNPPDSYYKCCKTKVTKQCVCINCGAIFHYSCLERQKNVIIIDSTRVTCCLAAADHDSLIVKNVKDLMNNLLAEKEKRISMLEDKISNLEKTNTNVFSRVAKSYAEIVSSVNKVPPILVKPKEQTTKGTLLKKIKNEVKLRDLNISVDTLKETKNGSLLIKCNNIKNNEAMKKEIEKISGLNCEIKTLDMKKPRVKIVEVDGDIDPGDIENLVVSQNFQNCTNEDYDIVHVQNNNRKGTKTVFMELAPELFRAVMKNKTVYIGWQRCRVYEDFNLSRCFKCNGYNHSAKKCQSDVRCQYCAGKHDGASCPDKSAKCCVNCLKTNQKFGTQHDLGHFAFEENSCETYKSYKQRVINQTNYY